ncbi:DUF2283 domain-containing protein [candidate division KSB1 bacterium]|nr:DUF2283 domain-containing protein [candidate division KSB1 bacterium]MBL7093376.1 DUF2283 domain-containing protein [candidate division KSB1 bacterium]
MATTANIKKDDIINHSLAIASSVVNLPDERMWINYDREADVMYLSFRKPQRATKTIETEDDILIRKDGNKIVGITIMNASTRGN